MDDRNEWIADCYRRYRPAIRRRCRRMLGDDSEDAVQEVFLRLVAHPPGDLVTTAFFWLLQSARNYCLNQIRDARTRKQLRLNSLEQKPALDILNAVAARDLTRRLVSSTSDRLVLVAKLHYVDGQSHAEIARGLGVSRRTIVTYLTEFRRRAIRASRQK